MVRPQESPRSQDVTRAPLSDRVASLSLSRTRVAYYYASPDNSTFRYRVGNMVSLLNSGTAESGIGATFFTAFEEDDLATLGDYIDVLVVCRAQLNNRLARLIARMRACGVAVMYDLDDFVFDPDYAPMLIETFGIAPDSETNLARWFAYCARIGAALRLCDAVFVSGEVLGREVQRATGLGYSVLPNFLSEEQVRQSELIWSQKLEGDFRGDGRWHVGYFSGSPSHDRDFALVSDALALLLRDDPRVSVRLVGFLDVPPALAAFAGRVERLGLQDTVELQWLIGEVDVSIAPLQDNLFTRCKSDLKWFEPAAVGTVVVSSPAGGVGARIRDGVNGRIARSFEWRAVLSGLVEDMAACRTMATHARSEAVAECTPESQRARVERTLLDAAGARRP